MDFLCDIFQKFTYSLYIYLFICLYYITCISDKRQFERLYFLEYKIQNDTINHQAFHYFYFKKSVILLNIRNKKKTLF